MEQDSIRKIWKIRNLLSLRNDQTEVTFRHRTELKYVSAFYNRWQLTTCWKELRGISWSNLQAVSDVTQLYFCYIEAIKTPSLRKERHWQMKSKRYGFQTAKTKSKLSWISLLIVSCRCGLTYRNTVKFYVRDFYDNLVSVSTATTYPCQVCLNLCSVPALSRTRQKETLSRLVLSYS